MSNSLDYHATTPHAFPFSCEVNGGVLENPGMELRDYFAAKAIPTAFNVDVLMHSKEELGANGAMDLCAKMAWKIADAMLAAREAKS